MKLENLSNFLKEENGHHTTNVYIKKKMDVPAILKNKIYDSFVARTDALFEWFKKSWRN